MLLSVPCLVKAVFERIHLLDCLVQSKKCIAPTITTVTKITLVTSIPRALCSSVVFLRNRLFQNAFVYHKLSKKERRKKKQSGRF